LKDLTKRNLASARCSLKKSPLFRVAMLK